MENRALIRKLMMAAGLLAALTILVCPAFKSETSRSISEVSAPGEEQETDGPTVVAVSADAVTSSQAVEVESANPYVVQEVITEIERPTAMPVQALRIPVAVITSLLRAVISPQAP